MTISVSNLTFRYEKRVTVLDQLSFSVKKGEFIGIFGPNGGGKTTLLNLLLGLLDPTDGRIEILGGTPKDRRERVGYVPQIRRFDKQFPISPLEVVLLGCLSTHRWGRFSKKAKEKAMEALEKVGLSDKSKVPFGSLSGGQIQRTLIARALVSDPELLLLDEATVGIDPDALAEIFTFLIGLQGKITILMVTHNLEFIAKEMNQLFCINQTLTHYTPEQVCEHFAMGLYHPIHMKKKNKDNA